VVHIVGLLVFFALVWPYDAQRRLVWEAGADIWFWVNVAQVIVFTALAILAFIRLARVTKGAPTVGGNPMVLTAAEEPVG